MANTISLPLGFATIDSLAAYDAGRAYIADRAARTGEPSPYATVEPVARYEDGCANPDCYVLVYPDGSAYIHSDADDEVWYDLDAYLSDNDLRLDGDIIVAIV